MRYARLWSAAVLLLVAELLIGCATRVIVWPPEVTVAWGHAKACSAPDACTEGGEVSETFSAMITAIANVAAEFFGDGPPAPITVNVPAPESAPVAPPARTCPTEDGVRCAGPPS